MGRHWKRAIPATLTEGERLRMPNLVLVSYCLSCRRVDYAFDADKEWEDYELRCPHCDRNDLQVLITFVRQPDGAVLEPKAK